VGRLVSVGRSEEKGKMCGRVNQCKYCVHIYVSGKMLHVENVPGMGEVGIKEKGGGGEFKYDIFDILEELLLMPKCNPTQNINKKEE
jgi:hypothetical protein